MDWLSPYLIALLFIIIALAIVMGRIRHEPPHAIALNAIGYSIFFLALGWASSLSQEAFSAAAVASLGSLLFTMAYYQSRAAKAATVS